MHLLKNESLANRVLIGLLAALTLMLGAWVWGQLAARPAAPPALTDYFGETASRAAAPSDRLITDLQARLSANPDDWPAYTQLGLAYLQKARETADPSYYQKAEQALDTVLAREPGDYVALSALGELALARHDFARALELGEKARGLNPRRAYAYGVIADAQVELGHYEEAVATVQQMVDLRPDLSSYSRVAYLRELHGDLDGAIEAMQWALSAGGPALENTLWTQVQLGHLYFHTGRLAEAETEYRRALEREPNYVHALAGLARLAAARGDLAQAIQLYTAVTERMPLAEYVIALGEVYTAAGQTPKAQQQYDLARAIDQLYRASGVNTDLELALFLAEHGDAAEAVTRARAAYAERPTVFAAEVLAWALHQAGDDAAALPYARESLKLGSQDALRLFRAGMIEYRLGHLAEAQAKLQAALDLNPYFSLRYAETARQTLAQITATLQTP
jgi:tetratricopeptide (TPR) repeat protein